MNRTIRTISIPENVLERTDLKWYPITDICIGDDMSYKMCKPQITQIDCRVEECYFHKDAACKNPSPALTLNKDNSFVCWSKKEPLTTIAGIKIYQEEE